LRTFLRLATKRGIDATSTKALAAAAKVSELTLFRHFGDKATLIREAIRLGGSSTEGLPDLVAADASTPEAAIHSLTLCLEFMRDRALANPGMLQFVMSEAHRHPELAPDLMMAPLRARALLERTIDAVGPQLRAGVERGAAVLMLQGLLLLTVLWTSLGWMGLPLPEWDALLADAARALIRQPRAPRRPRAPPRRRTRRRRA